MRIRCTIADVTYEVEFNSTTGEAMHVARWVKGRYGARDHTRTLWSSNKAWDKPQGDATKAAIALAQQLRQA